MSGLLSALYEDVVDDGQSSNATAVSAEEGVDVDASVGVSYAYSGPDGDTHSGSTEVGVRDEFSADAAVTQAMDTQTA